MTFITVGKSLLVSRFIRHGGNPINRKVVFVGLSLIVLVVLEIWVNNSMAVFGQRLASIESSQKLLQLENRVLENEIAKQTALGSIASSSASLGFIKPKSVQYIR